MVRINVTVDGVRHEDEVESRLLLVHYLRDRLGLVGTPVGCDTSNCGACTVLIDNQSAKSCTLLAVQADGTDITTVQGLADGEWHPIQKAFHESHALQCGYCTPGMMMAAIDLLNENADPSEDEIRHGLEGNLCRCTGYQNIVKAVHNAALAMGAAHASAADQIRSTTTGVQA
jgi:aerobic carbon-monoxide dehydrogenase small subunit